MLVLTRRIGETIHIGDGIAVTVIGVKGKQVRVGIKAPDYVRILRVEPAKQVPGADDAS